MGFKEVYQNVLKEYPDILTIEEMADVLGVSLKTGYKLIQDGKIKAMVVGKRYRIPKVNVLSYLKVNYIPA